MPPLSSKIEKAMREAQEAQMNKEALLMLPDEIDAVGRFNLRTKRLTIQLTGSLDWWGMQLSELEAKFPGCAIVRWMRNRYANAIRLVESGYDIEV